MSLEAIECVVSVERGNPSVSEISFSGSGRRAPRPACSLVRQSGTASSMSRLSSKKSIAASTAPANSGSANSSLRA